MSKIIILPLEVISYILSYLEPNPHFIGIVRHICHLFNNASYNTIEWQGKNHSCKKGCCLILTPEFIDEYHKIIKISINNSKISNNCLITIKNVSTVQYLDLSHCYIITDKGLEHLKELKQLDYLDLSSCYDITNEGLKHIKELKQLHNLNLSSCFKITNEGLEHLKELPLTYLNLTCCIRITDEGLEHLKELPLTCLHLSWLNNSNLSDCNEIIDESLKNLKALPILYLHVNWCHGITRECFKYIFGNSVKRIYC